MERRFGSLETRVTDIEDLTDESLCALVRETRELRRMHGRIADGLNHVGHGMALIMERMGLKPIDLPVVTMPTDAEVDAISAIER
ncbi:MULTISPECIES: hypothetical protein [unclassified Nocardia]|uniref:hypothetical protein n=1 Tax=unclassified Nocardia TaxID=2637762 RepID=UPI001CE3D8C3|nr:MULTISPECIES: hypothetical protein [unclassified Nocardia]